MSYNKDMIDIGLLSSSSAYRASVNSVYNAAKTSPVSNDQELSDVQNTQEGRLSPNTEINDEAIISDDAKNLLSQEANSAQNSVALKGDGDGSDSETSGADAKKATSSFNNELTQQEQQEVNQLRARDAEVKAHEQAHMAAAAGINASSPSFTYQSGPDGKKYAVGGEVALSFSESNDPQDTIAKAQAMKSAALAPASPSAQDLSVAQHADQIIAQQKQKEAEQATQDISGKTQDISKAGDANKDSSSTGIDNSSPTSLSPLLASATEQTTDLTAPKQQGGVPLAASK